MPQQQADVAVVASSPASRRKAFDAHVHVTRWDEVRDSVVQRAGRTDRGLMQRIMEDPAEFLAVLDAAGVSRAVLINYVAPDIMGFTDKVHDFISHYVKGHEDRLLACGGPHPRLVRDGRREVKRLVEDLGMRALKVHPPHQLVFPDGYTKDVPALRGIYEGAQEHGIPVIIHTGTSVFPGAKVIYGDPVHVDEVAVDFPDLKIVAAHAGRPLWGETAFFLARRHPNLFLDLSSIPPGKLLEHMPRLPEISGKCMYGSDWPGPGVPSVAANAAATRALPLPPEVLDDVLWRTAERVFGA